MRANLQIGSRENVFVNVLEIFNIKINGMTKSDKSNVDSVFLTDL